MALPDDDDDVLPRRRMAMDEVADSHASMGITPVTAPLSTNPAAPPAPASTGFGSGFGSTNASGSTGFGAPPSGGFGSGFGAAGASGASGFGGGFQATPTASQTNMANMAAAAASQPSGFGMMGSNGNAAAAAVMSQSAASQAQAQASVGLAQTTLDDKVIEEQIKKEEEHWVKAYWRPAMGWLYMVICLMDFIGFPLISMFLPVFFKHDGITANYVAWQSLTLSNGGLIHLAFGAILGVSAWTRGQEKLAKMN